MMPIAAHYTTCYEQDVMTRLSKPTVAVLPRSSKEHRFESTAIALTDNKVNKSYVYFHQHHYSTNVSRYCLATDIGVVAVFPWATL